MDPTPEHIRRPSLKPVNTVVSTNRDAARRILKRRKAVVEKLGSDITRYAETREAQKQFLDKMEEIVNGISEEIPEMSVRWHSELREVKDLGKKTNASDIEKKIASLAKALNISLELLQKLKKKREFDIGEMTKLKQQLDNFVTSSTEEIQKIKVSHANSATSFEIQDSRASIAEPQNAHADGILNVSMFNLFKYDIEGSSKKGKMLK